MIDLALRSIDGREKVFVTNKPIGTTTFFSGGDETGGHEIVFNMAANNTSKSVDLQFNQEIYMIGGEVSFIGAPLGAHFSIEAIYVIDSVETVHSSYGDKIFILGTGSRQYVSQDRDPIPNELAPGIPMFLRLTLYNSDPTVNAEHDAAAAFKFCGNLFTYRAITT